MEARKEPAQGEVTFLFSELRRCLTPQKVFKVLFHRAETCPLPYRAFFAGASRPGFEDGFRSRRRNLVCRDRKVQFFRLKICRSYFVIGFQVAVNDWTELQSDKRVTASESYQAAWAL